ncbi:hypothetical protein F5Y05DRAFT_404186 [Hypoxylon sp. FL0543]|nr:hypothetical protein F5Y05DRAFT_404186 [Hypoxylon sp. FL0543]
MAPSLEKWKNISDRLHNFRHNRRGRDSAEDKQSPQLLEQAPALATTSRSTGPPVPEKASGVSGQSITPATLQRGSDSPKSSKLQNPPGNTPGTSAMSSSSSFIGHSKKSLVGNASTGANSQTRASGENSALSYDPTTDKPPLGSLYNPIDLTTNPSYGSQHNPVDLTTNAPFNLTYESFPLYAHTQPSSKTPNMFTKAPFKLPSGHPSPFAAVYPSNPSAQNTPVLNQSNFAGNLDPTAVPGYLPPLPAWVNSQMSHPWSKHAKLHDKYSAALGPDEDQNTLADMAGAQFQGALLDFYKNPPYPSQLPQIPQLRSRRPPEEGRQATDDDSHEENSEPSVEAEQLPEDTTAVNSALKDLEPLQQFVHECLGRKCPKCNKSKPMDSKNVVKVTTGWAKGTGVIVLSASCQNVFCTQSSCLGCGKPTSLATMIGPHNSVSIPEMRVTVYWCCDSGRLAAIWALACGWEALSSKSQAKSCVANKVRARTHSRSGTTHPCAVQPSHSKANAKGVGYSSNRIESFPFQLLRTQTQTRAPPKNAADTQDHNLHQAYFRLLAALLPSCKRESALDTSPPDFLLHMLSRSPLMEKAATMLSNDSIGEISRHYQLHNAMLDLFDSLGSHPSTAGLVYSDRNLYYAKGGSLLDVSFGPIKNNSRVVVKDTGRPLVELLGNLAIQSQTVLRHAQSNQEEFHSREGAELLKLSQRLSETSTRHSANMDQFRTAMEITDNTPEVSFSQWHRENCVGDVPDEMIMGDFACPTAGGSAANPARGRMKRLITELSTLHTSLPEGIFIRHGSSRLDIMKVLIIGPKNTPYEHGMFEFDLCCPMDYPLSPPNMIFRTTYGGKVRFNPNLYEDGKICLSLLGTWSGEPWRGAQSTLLQVLVSIQSMILCEQPWYNEPGREDHENQSQSAKYSNDVRALTMVYALLPWIKTTRAQDTAPAAPTVEAVTSFWQETVQLYLRANAMDILQSLQQAVQKARRPMLMAAEQHISAALQEKGYLE